MMKWKLAAIPFLFGMGVASLPWVVKEIRFPDHFWFCNVTFHVLQREMVGLNAILPQKSWCRREMVVPPSAPDPADSRCYSSAASAAQNEGPAAAIVSAGQWKRFPPLLDHGYQRARAVHGIEILLRRAEPEGS